MTTYPDGPEASPGFLLWHVTLGWQRAVSAVLAPLDLTHVQFVLLSCTWWFDAQGAPPNQLQLARQAGTDVKMTSQVLRRLETKGLLARSVDPDDTRARRVRLTDKGSEVVAVALAAVEGVDREFFDGEAAGMVEALRRLSRRTQAGPPERGRA